MKLKETIEQTEHMTKQEFQTLFFHMLQIANTKYNMSIFLNDFMTNKVLEEGSDFKNESTNLFSKQSKQKKWKNLGRGKLAGKLDNINIRDYANEN